MSDELIHQGQFLSFYKRGRWEFVQRENASAVVAIAALTPAHEVVLIEQVRMPLGAAGQLVIEIPAGLVGDDQADDTIVKAAQRELIEECGYTAREMKIVSSGPSSAGLCNEIITMVVGNGLSKVGPGGGVGSENIKTLLIPFAEVNAYLAKRAAAGTLIDPKVYAALYFLSQA